MMPESDADPASPVHQEDIVSRASVPTNRVLCAVMCYDAVRGDMTMIFWFKRDAIRHDIKIQIKTHDDRISLENESKILPIVY